jgi:hypothetical protein
MKLPQLVDASRTSSAFHRLKAYATLLQPDCLANSHLP